MEEVLEEGYKLCQKEGLCCCSKHEEYFITDYEGLFDIEEYENIFELNSICKQLEESGINENVLNLLLNEYNVYDVIEIIENDRFAVYYNVGSKEEVVEEYLIMTEQYNNVPDWLKRHIDYKSIMNDWECLGNTYLFDYNNKICIEILA